MIHTISHIRVRYAETDRMDVVYHSNYLIWFETARILMLDEIGIPYLELEARDLRLPVLTVSAEYKSPARFDDRLDVHLFMREKPRARFRFDYEVRRGDTLLATGTTSHHAVEATGCTSPATTTAAITARAHGHGGSTLGTTSSNSAAGITHGFLLHRHDRCFTHLAGKTVYQPERHLDALLLGGLRIGDLQGLGEILLVVQGSG